MGALVLWTLLTLPASGDSLCPEASAPAAVSHRTIDSLLTEVRRTSFPELAATDITLNELRSREDFFSSGSELRTLLNAGPKRSYLVYVNPRLFADPPSREALRAVLAHELGHVVDYQHRSTAGLAGFTFHYLMRLPAGYERATDLYALHRGYGCGLIEYREWLYRHVSARTAVAKRLDYLTPEEIRIWLLSDPLPSPPSPGRESAPRPAVPPRRIGQPATRP